jgi:peptide-methionine (S)-S-oxide reductase
MSRMSAHDHHQQHLIKNPFGYRCHSATGNKVTRSGVTIAL